MSRPVGMLASVLLITALTSGCERLSPLPQAPSAVAGGEVSTDGRAPSLAFASEVFIDYHGPAHAGPGPHPTSESDDFQLTFGGARWFAGDAVEYRIVGNEPFGGANAAILGVVATWDAYITLRTFSRNDNTAQVNPCEDQVASTIEWAFIDGEGGIAGTTATCRNVVTKEIVGFRMTLDAGDSWQNGSVGGSLDVANVVSHEFGHAAGLGHNSRPASGCLTMYRYVAVDEIQKRTPGWGDKLGLDVLYGPVDTTAGACGA